MIEDEQYSRVKNTLLECTETSDEGASTGLQASLGITWGPPTHSGYAVRQSVAVTAMPQAERGIKERTRSFTRPTATINMSEEGKWTITDWTERYECDLPRMPEYNHHLIFKKNASSTSSSFTTNGSQSNAINLPAGNDVLMSEQKKRVQERFRRAFAANEEVIAALSARYRQPFVLARGQAPEYVLLPEENCEEEECVDSSTSEGDNEKERSDSFLATKDISLKKNIEKVELEKSGAAVLSPRQQHQKLYRVKRLEGAKKLRSRAGLLGVEPEAAVGDCAEKSEAPDTKSCPLDIRKSDTRSDWVDNFYNDFMKKNNFIVLEEEINIDAVRAPVLSQAHKKTRIFSPENHRSLIDAELWQQNELAAWQDVSSKGRTTTDTVERDENEQNNGTKIRSPNNRPTENMMRHETAVFAAKSNGQHNQPRRATVALRQQVVALQSDCTTAAAATAGNNTRQGRTFIENLLEDLQEQPLTKSFAAESEGGNRQRKAPGVAILERRRTNINVTRLTLYDVSERHSPLHKSCTHSPQVFVPEANSALLYPNSVAETEEDESKEKEHPSPVSQRMAASKRLALSHYCQAEAETAQKHAPIHARTVLAIATRGEENALIASKKEFSSHAAAHEALEIAAGRKYENGHKVAITTVLPRSIHLESATDGCSKLSSPQRLSRVLHEVRGGTIALQSPMLSVRSK